MTGKRIQLTALNERYQARSLVADQNRLKVAARGTDHLP